MKVFVTGATGFVGSHLVHLLLQEGHQVKILRRETSRLDAIQGLDIEHCIGDLDDPPGELARMLEGVDWVFHTAAVANYWRTGTETIYRVNVDGTRSLLHAAEQAGIKRFIFTSSAAAIGRNLNGTHADETTVFNIDPGLSPYGHSKVLAESEVQQAVLRGLDAVILNPGAILGPGDLNLISGTLILAVVQGAVKVLPRQGGTAFIDVRDVARAHLAAAEKGRSGERYILGAVNMSHQALIRLIAEVVDARLPRFSAPGALVPVAAVLVDIGRKLGLDIPGDGNQIRLSRYDLYFDFSKAWEELHRPEIEIRQSVEETYAWYAENGYLKRKRGFMQPLIASLSAKLGIRKTL